jgi:hypothetical protein
MNEQGVCPHMASEQQEHVLCWPFLKRVQDHAYKTMCIAWINI